MLAGQAWGAAIRPARAPSPARPLALVLAVGLIVSVIGGLTAPMLLKALDTPPEILDDAVRYARVMLVGAPLIFLLWLATSISRGVGDAVSPMWALIRRLAWRVVHARADRRLDGLPRLDVLSPAVSTLLGFTLALGWLAWRWRRRGHPLAPNAALLRELRFDPALTRSILKIGVPAALQMLTMAAAEIALLGLVNRHGAQATAAYGAVTQLMSWLQLPAMSLGISATILAAHAIGAGRGHRLGAIARTGLMMNVAVTGLFVCAAYALAPYAIGLFLKDAPPRAGRRIAAHRGVERGGAGLRVRAVGRDARQRHGARARHAGRAGHRGRGTARRLVAGRAHRPVRHLVGLRPGLHGDAGPAVGLLHAGLAPPDAAAPGRQPGAWRQRCCARRRTCSHCSATGISDRPMMMTETQCRLARTQGIEPSQ